MDVKITRAVVRFPVEGTIERGPIIRVGNSETLTMLVDRFKAYFFVMDGAYACSEVTVYGYMGPIGEGWQRPGEHTYYIHLLDSPQWVYDLVDLVRPFQAAPLFSSDTFELEADV